MIVAYTYKKYKDVHSIQNDEPLLDIQYTVTKLDCDSDTILGQVTLAPGETRELKFSKQGKYSVLVEAVGLGPESFEIIYYNDLLTSFINDVNMVVCGCKLCKTEFNCDDYLSSYIKGFTFLNVHTPLYNTLFDTVIQESVCIFSEEVNCTLLREKVYGKFVSDSVLAQALSFHYLAFYNKDLSLAIDIEERAFITAKYKYDKISVCIKKLGILPIISGFIPSIVEVTVPLTNILFIDSTIPNKLYSYSPVTEVSDLLLLPNVANLSADIAHTANKLWMHAGVTVLAEWDIQLSPFIATYKRLISNVPYSAGLFAIDDTTILSIGGTAVYESDISLNTAVNVIKFSLLANRKISGDYLLTATGKLIVCTQTLNFLQTHITQYDYATGIMELDIELTNTIPDPFGLYQHNNKIYIADRSGEIYEISTATPYTLTLVDTTPYEINGASQIAEYGTVHLIV